MYTHFQISNFRNEKMCTFIDQSGNKCINLYHLLMNSPNFFFYRVGKVLKAIRMTSLKIIADTTNTLFNLILQQLNFYKQIS